MTVAIIVCVTLALLAFLASPAFLGRYMSDRIIKHHTYGRAHTWADGLAKGEFAADFFSLHGFEEFSLETPLVPVEAQGGARENGRSIHLKGLWHAGAGERTIVFLHGVSWTLHGDIKYADEFLRRGWNVVMVDSRCHGDSEGDFVTFGFRERHDLVALVAAVRNRFPATRWLGIHGESMGASIALQALPLLESVDFCLADSAFSNLAKLSRVHLFKVGVPRIVSGVVSLWCDLFTRSRAGFVFSQVAPIEAIAKVQVPILFIHGVEDEITPWQMSREMHDLHRKQGMKTEILLQERALHTKSIMVDRARYLDTVWRFIDGVVPAEDV